MSKLLTQLEINIGDGEYVFKEGEFGDSLFMLQSGKVKLIQKSGSSKKLLRVVEANDFFGELAFSNPQNRNFSALAVGNCTLLKIDKNAFAKLVKNDVDFIFNYTAYLAGYLQGANSRIDHFNKKFEEQKIFSALMKDLLLKGKKDKSHKWTLVDLNGFVADNIGNLNRKDIMSLIDKMSKAGIVHIKTDITKVLWIGVKR